MVIRVMTMVLRDGRGAVGPLWLQYLNDLVRKQLECPLEQLIVKGFLLSCWKTPVYRHIISYYDVDLFILICLFVNVQI